MPMNDYCQVLGVPVPRPRASAHEPWCARHDDGCVSVSFELAGGLNAWLESDGRGVQLIVDGERGHIHLAIDAIV